MTKKLTPIVAIVVIGALLAYALSLHVDGVLLTGGVAILAGLGGFTAGRKTGK